MNWTFAVNCIGLVTNYILGGIFVPSLLKNDFKTNILPLMFMQTNALCWILYSYIQSDKWLFWMNIVPYACGLYYMTRMFEFEMSDDDRGNYKLSIICMNCGIFVFFFLTANYTIHGDIIGSIGVFLFLLFVTSPLTNIIKAIKTKDYASFSTGMSLATILNCSIWMAYGISIEDYFVVITNGIGLVLGMIQGVMCIFKKMQNKKENEGEIPESA